MVCLSVRLSVRLSVTLGFNTHPFASAKNEATIYLAREIENGGELENNSEKNG